MYELTNGNSVESGWRLNILTAFDWLDPLQSFSLYLPMKLNFKMLLVNVFSWNSKYMDFLFLFLADIPEKFCWKHGGIFACVLPSAGILSLSSYLHLNLTHDMHTYMYM